MNKRTLFFTSCLSLVVTSMVFAIRGDIEPAMGATFHLTNEQMGTIWSPAFWAFTVAIFISTPLVNVVGMRALHIVSAIGYIIGLLVILLAPHPTAPVASIFGNTGTTLLYVGFFILGLSQGLVEGVINPLVTTIYADEKTRRLNMLHAWWPGGQVIGGLLAVAMTMTMNASWQLKLGTIFVPTLVYLFMSMSLEYPKTERVTSSVPTKVMWKEAAKPFFILMFACMWMTAASELGPDQWFPSVMSNLTGMSGQGVLFLVYTAGLMWVLRFYFNGWAHKSPIRALFICSILTAIGLFWLGGLHQGTSVTVAFAAATVFGVGKSYFWPTMIGVTSERFPRGGALLLGLMGGAGMASVAAVLPVMGGLIDRYGQGQPGVALQYVAVLPTILIVIFGGMWIYFRSKGGYKPIAIADAGK